MSLKIKLTKSIKESVGQDVSEYQKWVDYDMEKYHKISEKTMDEIKKAGLSVVKDQYGQYEVIADRPVEESCGDKKLKESADGTVVFYYRPDYYDEYLEDDLNDELEDSGVVLVGNRDMSKAGDPKLLNYVSDDDSEDEIIGILNEKTGKDYEKLTIRGYAQRDWQNMYYPKDKSDSELDYIDNLYMGKYDVFQSNDGDFFVRVPHNVSWKGPEEIKKYISDEVGYVDKDDIVLKKKVARTVYDDADFDECLKEDTVKQGNYWVNKGKEGTHGKFKTKKEADAQRKAMYAGGFGESCEESKEIDRDRDKARRLRREMSADKRKLKDEDDYIAGDKKRAKIRAISNDDISEDEIDLF